MPAETDKFIVATFALWAGDFAFCDELLREFSSTAQTPTTAEHIERPEDIMRSTGALRLRQLRQKRGEFRELAAEYAGQGVEVTDKPLTLKRVVGKDYRPTRLAIPESSSAPCHILDFCDRVRLLDPGPVSVGRGGLGAGRGLRPAARRRAPALGRPPLGAVGRALRTLAGASGNPAL